MRALNLASDLLLFGFLTTLCLLYFPFLTIHIQVDELEVLCMCNQPSFVLGRSWQDGIRVRLFVCRTFDGDGTFQSVQVKEIGRGPVGSEMPQPYLLSQGI